MIFNAYMEFCKKHKLDRMQELGLAKKVNVEEEKENEKEEINIFGDDFAE